MEELARPEEGEASSEGRGTARAKVLRPRRDSLRSVLQLVQRGMRSDLGEVGRGQDAAQYPPVHRVASTEVIWPQTSVVPKLKNHRKAGGVS